MRHEPPAETPDDTIEIYTDGSYDDNVGYKDASGAAIPPAAGYGAVVIAPPSGIDAFMQGDGEPEDREDLVNYATAVIKNPIASETQEIRAR